MEEKQTIENLLDLTDNEIKQLHDSWDKGDCSLVGLVEIYLYQCIKKHKQENGVYYGDGFYMRNGESIILDPNKQRIVNGVILTSGQTKENNIINTIFPFDVEQVTFLSSDKIRISNKKYTVDFLNTNFISIKRWRIIA